MTCGQARGQAVRFSQGAQTEAGPAGRSTRPLHESIDEERGSLAIRDRSALSGDHNSLQPPLHHLSAHLRTLERLDMSWELFTRIVDQVRMSRASCCTGSASRCCERAAALIRYLGPRRYVLFNTTHTAHARKGASWSRRGSTSCACRRCGGRKTFLEVRVRICSTASCATSCVHSDAGAGGLRAPAVRSG